MANRFDHFFSNAYRYLTMALVCLMPVYKHATTFLIAALILTWIAEGQWKTKWDHFHKNPFAWLFVSFFGIHLLGLTYSENMHYGLFDIEVKLALFFFPLIMFSSPARFAGIKKDTFLPFIIGCIISVCMMAGHSFINYLSSYNPSEFFYTKTSFFYHPSYISLYFNFAIFWILNTLISGERSPRINRFIAVMSIILIGYVFLLNSKMGLISLVLVMLYTGLLFIRRKKHLLKQAIIGMIVMLSLFVSAIMFIPQIHIRLAKATKILTGQTNDNSDGTYVRTKIWEYSTELIKQHFWVGVGTGDVKDMLIKKYKENDLKDAYDKGLNAHNQFLQVFITFGIGGFLLFLCCLILPLIHAIKKDNALFIAFFILMFTNLLVESMIETQAGVMFYSFFSSFLLLLPTELPTKQE